MELLEVILGLHQLVVFYAQEMGKYIATFAHFIGESSNNVQPKSFTLLGLKLARFLGFFDLVVQSNSLFVVAILYQKSLAPWQYDQIFRATLCHCN